MKGIVITLDWEDHRIATLVLNVESIVKQMEKVF